VVCLPAREFVARYHVPTMLTPHAYEQRLRYLHDYEGTRVWRDPGGSVSSAAIQSRSDGLVMVYFARKESCEDVLKRELDSGTLAKPGELN
jgi:hypothetical protein